MNFINKTEPRFALVPRAAVHDRTLSFAALGLLVLFIECPDGTDVSPETLQRRGNVSPEDLDRLIAELSQAGFIGHGPNAVVSLEGAV